MARIVNLSESVLIAIHSLILISQKAPSVLSANDLAKKSGASENTIAKVLQRLTKENYLKSSRGPQGGFTLVKDARDISLLDIYEAVEGKLDLTSCPFNKLKCTFSSCIFGDVVTGITRDFKEYLKSKTIAQY